MKKVLMFFCSLVCLFLVSCSEDNMKVNYKYLNEHNACVVTVGKKYDLNKYLDHYYDYEEYVGQEYDYVCFGVNYEDRDNYTKDDLASIVYFVRHYEKYAFVMFFGFEEYSLLEDAYSQNNIEHFENNPAQYRFLSYYNGKSIQSGSGSSNVTDFVTEFICDSTFRMQLFDEKK